jgi:maltose alpha-D-glucosyltransferase/alpha-amylase
MDNPSWYKDAVIYQLHVKSFCDSNGDGIGDFPGLTSRLDYIASLGVNTVWLLPFYPSPRRDDGYDIADYRSIHPDYGTMRDFRRFVEAAHARGLRIVTELVVNHTSDRHPWFQRARRAPKGSWQRDFYVWADDDEGFPETRIIFLDTETSNWAWDEKARAYYWHRFYSHQPDLNFDNPRVLREIMSVLHFWARLGVDGFRLDAVPYLIERPGTNNENLPETHEILKRIRAEVDAHHPGRMLLAEANQWPEDVKEYFGQGDECHMCFHFPLMPRMYMAVAQEDRYPITDILRQTPDIPEGCQWALFLRNHDELTLEMVTDEERDYLWNTYAADRRARLNLGIRRRLAPLMEHDRRRIELMNALLLSLPGTPIIYYGDEIAMGDNIFLGDRDGVRTPMQWSPDRNGGFSRADAARLVLPVNTDPLTGSQAVNVEAEERNAHGLLHWTRRMVATRQAHPVFGRGTLRLLHPGNRRILAYLRQHEGRTILCVANLARSAQPVELDLAAFHGHVPVELNGRTPFPPIGALPYLLTLPPYGFLWFVLLPEADLPSWHAPAPAMLPEFETLVLRGDIGGVLAGANRTALEERILPAWLRLRRWARPQEGEPARITASATLPTDEGPALLVEIETGPPDAPQRYATTLALALDAAPPLTLQLALARARRRRQVGHLTDGFARDPVIHALFDALREGRRIEDPAGDILFRPAAVLGTLDVPERPAIVRSAGEMANASAVLGDAVLLKLFRVPCDGPHPEAEMTRCLSQRGFAAMPAFLGEALRLLPDGTERHVAVAHRYVRNQGTAATWLADRLRRAIEDAASGAAADADGPDPLAAATTFLATTAARLGEMHAILAAPCEDTPALAPQPADAHVPRWAADVAAILARAQRRAADAGAALPPARAFAGLLRRRPRAGLAIRVHGDLSLRRILVVAGEPVFIGFEGDPATPAAERRALSHAARDLAALLRSVADAARDAAHDAPPGADGAAALLDAWSATTQAAMQAAYHATPGVALAWPRARPDRDALLALFLCRHAAEAVATAPDLAAPRAAAAADTLRGLADAR